MMCSEILACSCCGREVPNDEEHNVSLGMSPYPHDTGFGMCTECGGDKKATDFKKKIGWAACTFYEARFDIARNSLSAETQKKFDASPYELKCAFISRLLEKGILKW